MKSYKINKQKIESCQLISDVLQDYQKQAENISAFNKAIAELNTKTKKLFELQSLAEKDNGLVEVAKNKCRTELIEKTLTVLTILKIYVYDQKKQKPERQLEKITPYFIQQCTDMVLINIVQKIWRIVNKYGGFSMVFVNKLKLKKIASNAKVISKLEKQYGLAPLMIRDMEEAYLLFINAFYIYETELAEKMDLIKKIKKTSSRAEKLIENKLDRFVSLFEKKSPEFCQAYNNARLLEIKSKKSSKNLNNIDSEVTEGEENPNMIDNHQLESKKGKKSKVLV